MLGETIDHVLDYASAPAQFVMDSVPGVMQQIENTVCGSEQSNARTACVTPVKSVTGLVITAGLAYLAYTMFFKGKG